MSSGNLPNTCWVGPRLLSARSRPVVGVSSPGEIVGNLKLLIFAPEEPRLVENETFLWRDKAVDETSSELLCRMKKLATARPSCAPAIYKTSLDGFSSSKVAL